MTVAFICSVFLQGINWNFSETLLIVKRKEFKFTVVPQQGALAFKGPKASYDKELSLIPLCQAIRT